MTLLQSLSICKWDLNRTSFFLWIAECAARGQGESQQFRVQNSGLGFGFTFRVSGVQAQGPGKS